VCGVPVADPGVGHGAMPPIIIDSFLTYTFIEYLEIFLTALSIEKRKSKLEN